MASELRLLMKDLNQIASDDKTMAPMIFIGMIIAIPIILPLWCIGKLIYYLTKEV